MKRLLSILFGTLMLTALWAMPTAAMASLVLLVPDQTTLTSVGGEFAYGENGTLTVTAPDSNGASIAIEFNNTINLNSMPYVHLSVTSDVPFNVALKVRSNAYDVYPQITGPSWYEHFQEEAPGMNEGVKAGEYTVVLNLKNYIDYNQLGVGGEGYVFVRSIHVLAKGQGQVTVHHLAVSDTPAFAANQQGATAAPTVTAVTTAPTDPNATVPTTVPTEMTTATAPTTAFEPGSVDIPGGSIPKGVVAAMIAAVVLIGGMVAIPKLKKHAAKPKE